MTRYLKYYHIAKAIWLYIWTLRVRLTIWYAAILSFILLAFGLCLYASLSHYLYAQINTTLRAESEQAMSSIRVQGGKPFLAQPRYLPADTVFLLYNQSGERVLDTDAGEQFPRGLAAALADPPADQATLQTIRYKEQDRWRLLTTPVYRQGRRVGVLQLARSQHDIESATEQLAVLMGVTIPFMVVLAVGVGIFLAEKALNPIDKITRTAERINSEDLSRRLELPRSRDEVGRLAATFDRMIDRLDRAFQRQGRFTADASHELRTPLAILINQADIALERKRSPDEYERTLLSIRGDAVQMTRLLGDLLTLAKADSGQADIVREPILLGELIENVTDSMSPLANERGVRLYMDTSPSVTVAGDRMRLTQLLINLVDNGIKYTPAGGRVAVSLPSQNGWAEIRIADTGRGIAENDLPHIFERFYRVDKTRSRSEGSTGLGLSICRWIAEAHGGAVTVRSRPDAGSEFLVRLPVF